MDAKYTIRDNYEIEESIQIVENKLFIPVKGEQDFSGVMLDNQKDTILLDAPKKQLKDGAEWYVLDFSLHKEKMGLVFQDFLSADEKVSCFTLFFLNGLDCFKINDKNKNQQHVQEIMCMEEGKEQILSACFLPSGNLHILLSDREDCYRKKISVLLNSVKQEDSICSFSCFSQGMPVLDGQENKLVRFELIGGNGKEVFVVEPEVVYSVQEKGKVKCEAKANIDFRKVPNLFASHWNLTAVLQIQGQNYRVSVFCRTSNKKIYNAILQEGFLRGYQEEGSKKRAYLDIMKSGSVRIFTGAFHGVYAYNQEEYNSFENFITNPELPFSKEIYVKTLDCGMGFFRMQLQEASFEEADEAGILVYDNPKMKLFYVPIQMEDRKAGIFCVDTTKFEGLCEKTGAVGYKFALAVRIKDTYIKSRLYDKSVYVENRILKYGIAEDNQETGQASQDETAEYELAQYMDTIFATEYEGEKMEACPYTNQQGYIMMRMCTKKNMSVYKIVCEGLHISVSDKYLSIKVKCPDATKKWKGFVLSYRYQKEEDKEERYFDAGHVAKEGNACIMSVRIPLENQKFKGIYWSIRPVFEEDGELCYCSIKVLKKELKEHYKKLFQGNCKYYDVGGEKYILFPFISSNGNVTLMYRTTEGNDGFSFRLKERLGLRWYQLLKKQLHRKQIMLVYEKYCYMASDNGYEFFKYCMENNMEAFLNRKIYYVIDKKSPDYEKVKKYDKNVLDFMSVRFIAYMLAAKLLVSSDVRSHAYAWRHRSSILSHVIQKKKHIFLQHGVTAMKKVDPIFGKANNNPTNLFVVTSEEEYDIVHKYFGYTKNEIALTGFARWDVLEDKSQGRKEILLMPTWRNWLDDVDAKTFKQSDYYKNYMKLLNSEKLHNILRKHGVVMNFYIHPKFKGYIGNFQIKGDQIRLIPFGHEPLNELMMRCNMLITDYSSVCWDVYYMGKPVLFYQFDIDTYLQTHGSYMNMEKDLFGDRTLELEELIAMIEENIQNEFQLKEIYKKDRKKHFSYIDKNNCKRICMLIKNKKW